MGLRLIWANVRLHPRDTIVIVGTLVLLAAIFLLYGYFYHPTWYARGFGPGWQCTYPGNGDPVCIKEGGTSGSAQQ